MDTTAITGVDWTVPAEIFPTSNKSRTHPASEEAQIAISVFIVILGIWSTLGNVLTILAISMHRGMKTKTNYFILSLAISDLSSGLIASPLWLYRRTWGYEDWQWGDFLCKLFWFTDESTSYCTAWHIASFAVWRYIGVGWPQTYESIAKRKVKALLIVIWAFALVFGGALFCTFYQVEDRDKRDVNYTRWPSCSIKTEDDGVRKHRIYYTFSSTCFMLVPMAVLFIASGLIARELLASSVIKSQDRKKKERRAFAQLGLVAASFLLGYIPNTSYVMWTTRAPGTGYKLDYWVQMGAYFALRTSECLNPIIYNITSTHIRKASIKVLRLLRNCGRSGAEMEIRSQTTMTTTKKYHTKSNLSTTLENSATDNQMK